VTSLPFALDPGGVLDPEPRAVFDAGAVFAAATDEHDPRAAPLFAVAWRDEAAGATLGAVVDEELARLLSAPGSLLIDREAVGDRVRTFALHIGPSGLPTASEQWRLLSGGRRWTVSAMTVLADQPEWGPRLAAVAATVRPA
jgi:hypothetical protein